MPETPQDILIFQITLCLTFAAMIFAASFIFLRARHKAEQKIFPHLGALIYGLLLGCFFAMFLFPVRMAMLNGGVEFGSPEFLRSYLPIFAVFLLLFRTDLISKLPIIGPPMVSYRTAMLRLNIERSTKRLEKLTGHKASMTGQGAG